MSNHPNLSAFQNASVLVTGASGFIGQHLVRKLIGSGAQVFGFSNTKSESIASLNGDVTKLEDVHHAVQQCRQQHNRPLDFIFHLAGQKNLLLSRQFPRETLLLSTQGTINVLEAARQQSEKPPQVVIVSSLAVYGSVEDQQGAPIKENHTLAGNSIYSISKNVPELIGQAYWHEYKIPTVMARLANVFGPGQSPEAVISSIIQQMKNQKNIKLGNVSSVRDFTYVEDTAEALMALAAANDVAGKAFNLGSGNACSIQDIVNCLIDLMSFKGNVEVEAERVRAQEKSVLLPDITLFKQATGWKPHFTLKEGLARTVESFQ